MRRGPVCIDRRSAWWNARGMAQCECGRPLGASGKLCARCDALRTLGLREGASWNEIRDTYRDLVKVWHPDRFSHDGKLRSKAEEKLKEVNAAFQRLDSSAERPTARAASAAKRPFWASAAPTRTNRWYSAPANQWYSESARESPRSNASAQEPPPQDASAPGFPDSNARTQSTTPEAKRAISKRAQGASAVTPLARAASATKKPEENAEAQKPYEISRTLTRISQWSSALARKTLQLNAPVQEPPRKDAFAWSFPNAVRPQSDGNARTQSPTPEAKRAINAALQRLNSAADTISPRATSATKKPDENTETQKPYETFRNLAWFSQWSSALARKTLQLNAPAQEPPRKDAFAWSFPNAARPQSKIKARTQSPTSGANRPINMGAIVALFSPRRISQLVILVLFVAFTRMAIDAYRNPTTAQDELMNQYYEAEAAKNLLSRPTAQDQIMNLYYEVEVGKNPLSQLQAAPTKAENPIVATSSSPASAKQDLQLPQKRSNATAVSASSRSNARHPVLRSTALRDRAACKERGGRLNRHGDCRMR